MVHAADLLGTIGVDLTVLKDTLRFNTAPVSFLSVTLTGDLNKS